MHACIYSERDVSVFLFLVFVGIICSFSHENTYLFRHKLHHLALRQIAPLLPHYVGHWELANLPIRKPAERTSTFTHLLKQTWYS